MKIKTLPLQIQKQILSPIMQQSISVLLLPLNELQQTIEIELQSNPLLESEQIEELEMKKNFDLLNNQSFHRFNSAGEQGEDEPDEFPIATPVSLEQYLLRQISLEFSDDLKYKIAELIIGNLDEDGYLKVTLEEIAELACTEDLRLVEEVLTIVQNLDPVGIASRGLAECLGIQIKTLNPPCLEPALRIVNEFWEHLGHKRYQFIARKLNMPLETVKEIAQMIARLEPRPARNFRPIQANIYIYADVTIRKDPEGNYFVDVNREGIPMLRINPTYRKFLDQPNITADERNFIRERMTSAINFIKSIQQRGETLVAITKQIIKKQKDFFDGHQPAPLPLTMKVVAEAIERNESTVSRAISNKYINTPQGLFPFKYFFSQTLFHDNTNNHISTQRIKSEIEGLINEENKRTPLSDEELKSQIERMGMKLARRTISKYRQALRIPPSHLRKV